MDIFHSMQITVSLQSIMGTAVCLICNGSTITLRPLPLRMVHRNVNKFSFVVDFLLIKKGDCQLL